MTTDARFGFFWAFVCLGCGGGQILNKQVTSQGNAFSFSADFKGGYSGSDQEIWSPTTSVAWVTWTGTALTTGQVELQLFDAQGTSVDGETVLPSSVPAGQATTSGIPGPWRVDLKFQSVSGTVALQIQGSTGP